MPGDAFDAFYARYVRRVRAFAAAVYGRADADDIAQETMTRAWTSYAGLDAARDPWPWLTAIARNVARDRLGGPRAVPLAEVPARQPDAVAAVEERQLLRAALGRLSSSDRDVLVLRELHELTFDEVGRLTGRSANTVRQQAFRARQRLKEAYTSIGGRAGGVVGALRWRPWADAQAQVAAAVVAGALLAGGAPPAPAAPAPGRAVAAGPVARGGANAGPAAGRAAPVQPLQLARAARVVVPRAAARQVGREVARPAARRTRPVAQRSVPTRVRGGTGYRGGTHAVGDMLACAAARVCQMTPGTQ